MIKKKLTEREHLENKSKLSDIIINKKDEITIGGNKYMIGALTYNAKWRISAAITAM